MQALLGLEASSLLTDALLPPQTLRQQQATGEVPTMVEVRGSDEYSASHMAGARHIPVDELVQRLDELPRDRLVVTYCSMRHRGDSCSERAAELLRQHGYQAQALDGGLPAWEVAGYPVERRGGGPA